MAFTKILLALSFVALSNAFLLWPNGASSFAGSKNDYTGFPAPRFPLFPDFSGVLNFPTSFVSSAFSGFPRFPSVPFPSPDDIRNTKARPGQTYTGLFTSSGGGGGGVIIANIDGQVLEKHFGETSSTTIDTLKK
uniref:Seroin1 n=1 Tax=Samia ricini TaxID=63990 RepID=A0A0M3VH88_SAMRI|nr:seroin1 [Samia ricini]